MQAFRRPRPFFISNDGSTAIHALRLGANLRERGARLRMQLLAHYALEPALCEDGGQRVALNAESETGPMRFFSGPMRAELTAQLRAVPDLWEALS
ncbi:hypothetical protein [Pseudoroseicyclus aestuarii]|uniref:hypothetical protein n=1 Tax=Pseudoroseicyclus aestuarii TaxID=1795041 RepID=UPI0011B5C692|nr:hypothetical protein [Pseudoroseicyclus aestuarii]